VSIKPNKGCSSGEQCSPLRIDVGFFVAHNVRRYELTSVFLWRTMFAATNWRRVFVANTVRRYEWYLFDRRSQRVGIVSFKRAIMRGA